MGKRLIWHRGVVAVTLALVTVGVLAPASGASHPAGRAGSLPQCIPTGPMNTTPPVLSGSTTPGSTLSTTTGSWTPVCLPITQYIYAWFRNGAMISGATGSTYMTSTGDGGATFQAQVTACDSADDCNSASSNTITMASVCGAPTNSGAPTLSGHGYFGYAETTSNGSWNECGSNPVYSYRWLRAGALISGATSDSYTPAYPSDWLQALTAQVQLCDSGGCSGYVTTSNSLTIDVRIVESNSNYVEFENKQADMWIGLVCAHRNTTYGSWKTTTNTAAGPGYVSRLVRLVGARSPLTVAQPYDPAKGITTPHGNFATGDLQGVGVFGTHIATSISSEAVAAGSYCAGDLGTPLELPGGSGVIGTPTVNTAPDVTGGDKGVVAVTATIGSGTVPIFAVTYTTHVHGTYVSQWTSVKVACGGLTSCGTTYYVKEPKIDVTLNEDKSAGDDYTRAVCFNNGTSWALNAVGLNYNNDLTRWAGTDPTYATMACKAGSHPAYTGQPAVACSGYAGTAITRERVLFDYGTTNDCTIPDPTNCVTAGSADQCFMIVGKGFPGGSGPGVTLSTWEGTGTSFTGTAGDFDEWALKESPNTQIPGWSDDCGAPADNSSSGTDNRRWEIAGFDPNPEGYDEHEAFFKAWEGGTGPSGVGDCDSLYRKLDAQGDDWGAYTAWSFGPGALTNTTNPN
jgi:hypothetical protein